jgi:gliding motility-associated-like protein
MKKFLLYLFILLISNASFSQNYAQLNCVSLNDNGYITLNWNLIPSSCGGISEKYEIYRSNQATTGFSLIDTIKISNQTNYTLTSIFPENEVQYFYIKTINSCSENSETLNTISLNVTDISGVATLNWNNYLGSISNSKYYIHRAFTNGNWQLIDSVNSNVLNYKDTLHVCGDSVEYKISMKSTCKIESNSIKEKFTDKIEPSKTVLNYVSINPDNNFVELAWLINTDLDVVEYEIKKHKKGFSLQEGWEFLTIVENRNTDFYTFTYDENYDAYIVIARDNCTNVGLRSDIHQPINITAKYDACDKKIELNWTAYSVWSDISKYEIYASNNSSEYTMIKSVSGTTNTYIHNNVLPNFNYKYYIKAYKTLSDFRTNSNVVDISTDLISSEFILSANYASVINDNEIEIAIKLKPYTEIKEYKLQKSTQQNAGFETIKTFNNSINLIDSILYIDNESNQNRNYFYKLTAINNCGNEVAESNITNTIYLKVDNTSNLKHRLFWKNYHSLQGGVEKYNIYRKIDDKPFELINSFSFDKSYVDDISAMNFTGIEGEFCYYVEAIEQNENYFGEKSKTQSNLACAEQFPRVFIPNAFTPNGDGNNDFLTPYVSFVDAKDYIFIIYNRWGNRVFETTNPTKDWDGKLNGKLVETGVYTYFLRFVSADDKVFEDKGTISIF